MATVNLSMDLSGGLTRCRFLDILRLNALRVRRNVEYESSLLLVDESCKNEKEREREGERKKNKSLEYVRVDGK